MCEVLAALSQMSKGLILLMKLGGEREEIRPVDWMFSKPWVLCCFRYGSLSGPVQTSPLVCGKTLRHLQINK